MQDPSTTWHRDAIDRGIDYIVLTYDKAEGLVFCPTHTDHLFRIGGDYDGAFPVTAEQALAYFQTEFNPVFVDRVQWFIPWLEKITRGEDFSLDDLQLDTRNVRLITGKWPW